MSSDRIGSKDGALVTLGGYAAPAFPCLKCGRECVDHSEARKICAHPSCRTVQPGHWSPGGHKLPDNHSTPKDCPECYDALGVLRVVDQPDHVETVFAHPDGHACANRVHARHYLRPTA